MSKAPFNKACASEYKTWCIAGLANDKLVTEHVFQEMSFLKLLIMTDGF